MIEFSEAIRAFIHKAVGVAAFYIRKFALCARKANHFFDINYCILFARTLQAEFSFLLFWQFCRGLSAFFSRNIAECCSFTVCAGKGFRRRRGICGGAPERTGMGSASDQG